MCSASLLLKSSMRYNITMLIQSNQIPNLKIASMHTGQPVAEISDPIIDPFRLEVVGFYTDNSPDDILLTGDIREMNTRRAIIDSSDVFSGRDELLRLQKVLNMNYRLEGKQVVSKSGQKLGKVESFVVDTLSWEVQKIYAQRPVWKAFNNSTLIIDRKQIIEVNETAVVVEDATARKPELATRPVPQ